MRQLPLQAASLDVTSFAQKRGEIQHLEVAMPGVGNDTGLAASNIGITPPTTVQEPQQKLPRLHLAPLEIPDSEPTTVPLPRRKSVAFSPVAALIVHEHMESEEEEADKQLVPPLVKKGRPRLGLRKLSVSRLLPCLLSYSAHCWSDGNILLFSLDDVVFSTADEPVLTDQWLPCLFRRTLRRPGPSWSPYSPPALHDPK